MMSENDREGTFEGHMDELCHGMDAYCVFKGLNGAVPDTRFRTELQTRLVRFVEVLLAEEFSAPKDFSESFGNGAVSTEVRLQAFDLLIDLLECGGPRSFRKRLLKGFAGWLTGLDSDLESGQPVRDQFGDYAYDCADPRIRAALTSLAAPDVCLDAELLRGLSEAITPMQAYRYSDARHLIRDLPKCFKQRGIHDAERVQVARLLILAAGEGAFGSARWIMSALPKALNRVPEEHRCLYLGHCLDLLGVIGIRMVSFSMLKLPRLYELHGAPRTSMLIEQALGVAHNFGATAGEWLVRGRTKAGKRILGKS